MVFYFRIIILVSLSFEKVSFSNGEVGCRAKGDCGSCIQTQGCSWCSRIKNVTEPKSGCYDLSQILNVCEKGYEEDPEMIFRLITDVPSVKGSQDPIQMRPQEVELKMRTGDQFTIDIEFRQAENYPIDLYYLMDFSFSMRKHKNDLSKLGNTLADTMRKISTNFHIGFGSFVDKVTLPYVSTVESDLKNPCSGQDKQPCITPYSFKNHLPLGKDSEKFSVEVAIAPMSSNIDAPEGVFDGLMQAMVCKKEINWREKARHVIVVSTNGEYHIAGDGKLGGIFEPNDGKCHLDKNGLYTHGLLLDYPSVSHINKIALDNNMNIIFAVPKEVNQTFVALTGAIDGASIGLLDQRENIAELVKVQYDKISTKIELTDNSRRPIFITYSALCPGEKEWATGTNACSNVKIGSTAKFKAHITLKHCSEKDFNKQEIKIKPIGINETLTIHLQAICDCNCSKSGNPGIEKNSKHCSNSGDLICGQCKCPDDKIGEKCECDKIGFYSQDDSLCIAPDSLIPCSGQGECKCGLCECRKLKNPDEVIDGRYCECDNYSCEKRNGRLCSGNGDCNCKKCDCYPGWTGEACDCSLDDRTCKSESDMEICSGRGSCECGVCHCKTNQSNVDAHYSGKYCQICMTCKQECYLYNDCVECLMYNTRPFAVDDCSNCSGKFSYDFVEDINEARANISKSNLCLSADHSGCSFRYIYYYNESEHLIILADKKKLCPEEVNLIAVIAGTTGSTVLIGLLSILIWKIVTTIYDKREFEKFERERALAKWGREDNPLYKTAVRTYKNVAYKKECE